ncbi:hypothetical protein [Sphingobium sp. BS19]|uniref:hypothetical protein n=1 Tax=Sphingobium sp. BS19 TaxID=3018973 RepID=UPI0022EF2A4B|nr:hypothetical protein [Sphingobium sp. BS19]GLI97812.1 hypothetical protein Sbs19_16300 [Sphingobium sp. BS19]
MARRSNDPVHRARHLTVIAVIFLALSTLLSLGLWMREHAVATADAGLKTQELALARGDSVTERSSIAVDAGSQPRLLLSDAIYRARAIQSTGVMGRDNDLASLSRQVDLAIDARPHWAQAWVVKAYIESLRPRSSHLQASLAALSRSYSDAPFLRDASGWRVTYGMAQWESLDGFVRNRVIEEAVWLSRVDPDVRRAIFGAARATRAYEPLVLRWRELRLADGNYLANGRSSLAFP